MIAKASSQEKVGVTLKHILGVKGGQVEIPQSQFDFILSSVAADYKVAPRDIMQVKWKRDKSGPRALCYFLLRKYTSLSYSQLGKIFGIDKGFVCRSVQNIEFFIANPKHDKDLFDRFERINTKIEEFNSQADAAFKLRIEPKAPQDTKELAEQLVKASEEEFSNFTGEESSDTAYAEELPPMMENPDLVNSPLNRPVIDRNIEQGMSSLLNQSAVVEDAQVVEASGEKAAPTSPAPGFAPPEPAADDIEEEEVTSAANTDDVGPMQFDTTAPGGPTAPNAGYALPPEMGDDLTNFSTTSIMDMAGIFIPGGCYMAVEMDEFEVISIVKEVPDQKFQAQTLQTVRQMNQQAEAQLEKACRKTLPYMEGPLRKVLKVENLTVSPVGVLVILCLWLAFTMFQTCRKIRKHNDMYMSQLKDSVDELKMRMEIRKSA
jgi:hypothetical protein